MINARILMEKRQETCEHKNLGVTAQGHFICHHCEMKFSAKYRVEEFK